MSLSGWLLLGGALWAIKSITNKDNEKSNAEHQNQLEELEKFEIEKSRLKQIEKARKSIPCNFNEGISEEEFKEIVYKAKNKIKRIKDVQIEGATVLCTAESQTGYTTWDFCVDFNDWGHITGVYWRKTENTDSKVPKHFEELVSSEISNLLDTRNTDRDSFADIIYTNLSNSAMVYLGTSYTPQKSKRKPNTKIRCINTVKDSSFFIDEHIYVVLSLLLNNGFVNLKSIPVMDINENSPHFIQQVAYVSIDGYTDFRENAKFEYDAEIIIYYHDIYDPIVAKEIERQKRKKPKDVKEKNGAVSTGLG